MTRDRIPVNALPPPTVRFDPELTLFQAREQHFALGGFSEAAYRRRWVSLRIGPMRVPFPNTPGRARALPFHDLHHVLTEYATTWRGEAEIGAWELASGCGTYATAWWLNFGGVGIGAFIAPRAVACAFLRGRRSRNLYGQDLAPVLDRSVGSVRAELGLNDSPSRATWGDSVLMALCVATGVTLAAIPIALAAIAVSLVVR